MDETSISSFEGNYLVSLFVDCYIEHGTRDPPSLLFRLKQPVELFVCFKFGYREFCVSGYSNTSSGAEYRADDTSLLSLDLLTF